MTKFTCTVVSLCELENAQVLLLYTVTPYFLTADPFRIYPFLKIIQECQVLSSATPKPTRPPQSQPKMTINKKIMTACAKNRRYHHLQHDLMAGDYNRDGLHLNCKAKYALEIRHVARKMFGLINA